MAKVGHLAVVAFDPEEEPVVAAACIVAAELAYLVEEASLAEAASPVVEAYLAASSLAEEAYPAASYLVAVVADVGKLAAQA